MKLNKDKANFNIYKAEFTYGEILIIRDALANTPGMGPEADEMLEGFSWYLQKMPEPGEEGDKKEGTSDGPNMAKAQADDALSPMLLEPAPGQEDEESGPTPPQEKDEPAGEDEETLGDHLGVKAEKKAPKGEDEGEELPEPPSRE